MNVHDSEWLANSLELNGLTPAPIDSSQVVLINTCSVREKPEKKVQSAISRVRQVSRANPEVLVGVLGCVAQQLGSSLFDVSSQVRLVAGPDAITQVPDAIKNLLANNTKTLELCAFNSSYEERKLSQAHLSGPKAYVSIMQGCDNFCSYCIVPFTRGRQKSRKSAAILDEAANRVRTGAKELTLLGQNVNAYGCDKYADGCSFADLLSALSKIPGLLRLRYVTAHPKDMRDADITAFATIKTLCPMLHLPLQSGSDRILEKMRRRYTRSEYLKLLKKLRKARPELCFSTDLIVGFPGETEADFQDTLGMVEECGFISSYSFCYSDRPGTRASLFPDKITHEIKLERLQKLQALQEKQSFAWLKSRVGQNTEILLEKPSLRSEQNMQLWEGRDPFGITVHVDLTDKLTDQKMKLADISGTLLPVEIKEARKHCLVATVAE